MGDRYCFERIKKELIGFRKNKKQKQADFIQVMRAKQNEKFAKGLEIDNRIAEISRKAP